MFAHLPNQLLASVPACSIMNPRVRRTLFLAVSPGAEDGGPVASAFDSRQVRLHRVCVLTQRNLSDCLAAHLLSTHFHQLHHCHGQSQWTVLHRLLATVENPEILLIAACVDSRKMRCTGCSVYDPSRQGASLQAAEAMAARCLSFVACISSFHCRA